MGGLIEINDTLQITREQGFPTELDYENHKMTPLLASNFGGREFDFQKPGIRIYKIPPVRNFLVENRDGKWLYWGLIHIVEVKHDYINGTTSGRFKIVYIYTPEEMIQAHLLIDRRPEVQFFKQEL